MTRCLLAPVPVEHIDSALEAYSRVGRVAFATGDPTSDYSGSSTWELFTRLGEAGEFGRLPVLIHASLSGQSPSHPRYVGQVVSYQGVLTGYEVSRAGLHARPEERPTSALLTDRRGSVGFWLVERLAALPQSAFIKLSALRTDRAGKPGRSVDGVLRGPVLAHYQTE